MGVGGGVIEPEGREQHLVEHDVQRLAGDRLDDRAEELVVRVGVASLALRRVQRLWREVGVELVAHDAEDLVERHRRILAGEQAVLGAALPGRCLLVVVRQPGGVPEQVLDRDLRCPIDAGEHVETAGHLAGQDVHDAVAQGNLALFGQTEHGDRGEELRHTRHRVPRVNVGRRSASVECSVGSLPAPWAIDAQDAEQPMPHVLASLDGPCEQRIELRSQHFS